MELKYTKKMEEEVAIHSSILAWKILWTEEPGSLQSMGSQRLRHAWARTHTKYEGRENGEASRGANLKPWDVACIKYYTCQFMKIDVYY